MNTTTDTTTPTCAACWTTRCPTCTPRAGPSRSVPAPRRSSIGPVGAADPRRGRGDRGGDRRSGVAGPAPAVDPPAAEPGAPQGARAAGTHPAGRPGRTATADRLLRRRHRRGAAPVPRGAHLSPATADRPAGGGRRGSDREPAPRPRLPELDALRRPDSGCRAQPTASSRSTSQRCLRRPTGHERRGGHRDGVQSLVWTAQTAAETKQPVGFTVDGHPSTRLLGIDTCAPVPAGQRRRLAVAGLIASPAKGRPCPLASRSRARPRRSRPTWSGSSSRATRSCATASPPRRECCTLSPYSFTVTAPPGEYTLVVHDTDESDGEGVGTSEDTKQITVE